MTTPTDTPSVVETRLVHDVHRRATTLLADATAATSRPTPHAVDELRDFTIAALRHHHESEDRELWALLRDAAPELADPLARLSREHSQLDAALDVLRGIAGDARPDELAEACAAVRDLVHEHLAHEEPVLFPALREHVTDVSWTRFSQRTIASSPANGRHLLVALLDAVGEPEELEVIYRHLPPAARELHPTLLDQGQADLAALVALSAGVEP
jgi:hemerythrin-like domain-containing protein